MAPEKETSLVAEIPCFPGDHVDAIPDEVIAAQVIDELSLINLIGREDVMEWRAHRLPFAYPVYEMGYAREVAVIKNGLASLANLDTLGRAGNFFYSHLHDQLRLSKDYIESLALDDGRNVPLRRGSDERNVVNLSLASR